MVWFSICYFVTVNVPIHKRSALNVKRYCYLWMEWLLMWATAKWVMAASSKFRHPSTMWKGFILVAITTTILHRRTLQRCRKCCANCLLQTTDFLTFLKNKLNLFIERLAFNSALNKSLLVIFFEFSRLSSFELSIVHLRLFLNG